MKEHDNNYEALERSPFEVATIKHLKARNMYMIKKAELEAATLDLEEAERELAKFYPKSEPRPSHVSSVDWKALSTDSDFQPQ